MNDYADLLRARLLRLVKLGQELKALPLEDVYAPLDLPVFIAICMLANAAGVTEIELREAMKEAPR